ncbi:ceramide synthase LOH2-like isoform X5 [Citrus sinensis]|uniref:ceramide synthase LOH2-like isoform X5 n=1 Tax=Citrus sinensis TaxID=2711 RepID=UPI002277E086|nr:ceramide synthase LOH2-like isoform X5 [Citrus sinensis]
MSPQLHITVAQSQAKPPLLGGIRIRQPTFVRDTFIYYLFNTMLPMLFVVQICWWVLISSMIWRQLKSGQLREDIRSG